MKKKNRKQKFKRNLNLLTPKQLGNYNDSLEILRLVRRGVSFTQATTDVRISPSTAKKFVGSALRKKDKRIIAKKSDSLIRFMTIYENGREVDIQVRGNKKSKRIGQYHSAIGRAKNGQEPNALQEFEDETIIDINRTKHRFETDIEKIRNILDRIEDEEFVPIYKRG